MSRRNRQSGDAIKQQGARIQEPMVSVQDPPAIERVNQHRSEMEEIDRDEASLKLRREKTMSALIKAEEEAYGAENAQRHQARRFWPRDVPMPAHYIKRSPKPCPKCRRVRLDNGGIAVKLMHSGKDLAFFRCTACSHRWKLQVQHV